MHLELEDTTKWARRPSFMRASYISFLSFLGDKYELLQTGKVTAQPYVHSASKAYEDEIVFSVSIL